MPPACWHESISAKRGDAFGDGRSRCCIMGTCLCLINGTVCALSLFLGGSWSWVDWPASQLSSGSLKASTNTGHGLVKRAVASKAMLILPGRDYYRP